MSARRSGRIMVLRETQSHRRALFTVPPAPLLSGLRSPGLSCALYATHFGESALERCVSCESQFSYLREGRAVEL